MTGRQDLSCVCVVGAENRGWFVKRLQPFLQIVAGCGRRVISIEDIECQSVFCECVSERMLAADAPRGIVGGGQITIVIEGSQF